MKMQTKLQDIVDYVLAFRKGKAFENWSARDIANTFYEGYKTNQATAFVNEFGDIGGVVVGKVNTSTNTFHILNLLTTDKRALKAFVKLFHTLYDGYTITGNRRSCIKFYNTNTLCNKLLART